jgi:predicted GNAT superfamily acetyltransferase
MNSLVVWTVIDIVALIAGLAVYLYIVGAQLTKVAANLEDAADLVWQIKKDAEAIEGGLTSINTTGGVVAGALPLLYGMAEGIVVGATFQHDEHVSDGVNRPAMGTRRSRQMHGVGVSID